MYCNISSEDRGDVVDIFSDLEETLSRFFFFFFFLDLEETLSTFSLI
jgi:hypothetical protein